jgi:hypothetical protein
MKQYYLFFKLFLFFILFYALNTSNAFAGNAYSYNFNGTDESLYISNASGLNVTDRWTFEAWIYVNSVSSLHYSDFMFRDGIFSFQVKDPLGSGDFALDFYNRDNGEELSTDASGDLTFNTWYHVAATFDGSEAKLMVNGTVVDSDATSANWILNTNSNNFNIAARYSGGYSNYFDGQIDEIRLSKIARTASNMQTAYRTEAYTIDTNTLLLMHFDDGAATPTYETGTGFSGTMHTHNTGTSNYLTSSINSVFLLQPKYRTKASGNWNSAATWQFFSGESDSWEDATLTPDYHNDTITVLTGHSVNITSDVSLDEITVENGASLEVMSSVTVTLYNGTGTDLDVYGILKKSGVILRNSGATITVENGGKYQHNTDGVLSTITWETGSTCEIVGVGSGTTTLNLGNTGQNFQNFVWNVPTQSCDVIMEDFTDTYGDFTLENTNGHELKLHNTSGTKQVNIGGTGNCYINGGTLNINSGSGDCYFVIYNSYTQTGGTLTATGSGTGYFRFGPLYVNHSGTFTKTGGTLTPDDFQINRRYTLTLASDFDAGDTPFTVHGKMTIPTGYTFDFDSTFIVKSTSSYNGSLINHGTVSSDMEVECYFTHSQWHGISAPVSGLKAGDFYLGGNPDVWMLRYNESTNDYTYISDTNTQLGDMKGWFIWLGGSSNHTFTFEGPVRTGTIGSDNNMIRTSDTTGYNFVGNPFTSAIDWDAATGWTKTGLDATIYVYNNGNWATYNSGTGLNTNGGSRYIAMNQGFFVQVTDGGGPYPEHGTLKMTSDVCVHSDTAFMKTGKYNNQQIIKLNVKDGELTDETIICLNENATEGWDPLYDAHKLFSFNHNHPQIFSTENGFMSINSLPPDIQSIPIDVKGVDGNTLTISLTQAEDFDCVFLTDNYTGNVTNLKKKEYSFIYDENVSNRFFITFVITGTPEVKKDNNNDLVFVYGKEKTVYVYPKQQIPVTISLFNLSGQKLNERNTIISPVTFNVNVSGYYIVKTISKTKTETQKIFVR